jgi:hypothetical protein
MAIFLNKEGKYGFSPGIKIFAYCLYPKLEGYIIIADTN